MRLTIIPSDMAVYKDGVCHAGLLWEGTPDGVHALQWNGATGWIEFIDDQLLYGARKPNEEITELPKWAEDAVSAWEAAELQKLEQLEIVTDEKPLG